MQRHFRNEKGEFCSAKEWFAMEHQILKMITLTHDIQEAETRLAKMREEHPSRLSEIELAILGAESVSARQAEIFQMTADNDGAVVIWWEKYSGSVSNRHAIIREISEIFHAREAEQASVVAVATATYVETE